MIIDAQEYINELKCYNRYQKKLKYSKKKYKELERELEKHISGYVSPGSISYTVVTKFVKGKLIKKRVPLPKLDYDPNRQEIIRRGIIDQQDEVQKDINYYSKKIKKIKDISSQLPKDISDLAWNVYVRKKYKEIADEKGYTVPGLYRYILEELESLNAIRGN